ncbi:hypothetical protein M9H77_06604 [Catharanthus roseus]|uniref:Uncharacterized protein n=1 Tax=Catharanthus roseus TaxID=4058 RepID=A0ACC0BSR9_CATRO|nr:hypothetical protein M9H77_06604 [Catharanthus roseus]
MLKIEKARGRRRLVDLDDLNRRNHRRSLNLGSEDPKTVYFASLSRKHGLTTLAYRSTIFLADPKKYDPFLVFEGIGSCRVYKFIQLGSATMAVLYRFMGAISRQKTKSIGDYNYVWEFKV